ncbi:MAG: hypothetical protein ACYC46_02840 [Acidobacteriaceae bacterium]
MSEAGNVEVKTQAKRRGLSLDGWAVTLALALALLVRLGALKHIPW